MGDGETAWAMVGEMRGPFDRRCGGRAEVRAGEDAKRLQLIEPGRGRESLARHQDRDGTAGGEAAAVLPSSQRAPRRPMAPATISGAPIGRDAQQHVFRIAELDGRFDRGG